MFGNAVQVHSIFVIIYDKYRRLLFTWTLANSNQSRFPLDFTSYIYCLLPSVTWSVDNLNFPAQQQQQQHQQFIEVGNIEFVSKQLFQFFVFAFSIVVPVQIQGLSLWINQAFVVLCLFQNITPRLLLLLKWSVPGTCIPSPSFCIFSYFWLLALNPQ